MKDLGHGRNVDLDQKKPGESTRAATNLHTGIVAPVASPIAHKDVNVLEIERKDNMTEAENETDTAVAVPTTTDPTTTTTMTTATSEGRPAICRRFRQKC